MTMDRLDQLRAFVTVADAGSFAAAGRAIGRSRDNVSKLLAELEARLDVLLFERSTRRLRLTERGQAYLDKVRPILRQLETADRLARAEALVPSGQLRVHAPLSFGIRVLSPAVGRFLAAYPEVQLLLTLDDRILDRPPPDVDVTLRIAEAAPDGVVIRPLRTVERHLYAAPRYLEAAGRPETPRALAEHLCLHVSHQPGGARWQLCRGKVAERVDISGHFACNVGVALADAAAAGAGIAILPDYLAAPYLASGALERILPDWAPPRLELFALLPPSREATRRVEAFLDFMSSAAATVPA
jgi:DNA-binding transcriptional LysR family regulator